MIRRYYLLTWPCFIYGVVWAIVMKNQFKFLMMTDKEKWKVIWRVCWKKKIVRSLEKPRGRRQLVLQCHTPKKRQPPAPHWP